MSRQAYRFTFLVTILTISVFSVPASISVVGSGSPMTSWNPRVSCTPLLVRIRDITANQTQQASFNASPFTPGTTTTVPGGSAKRWLTPGPTPPGWVSAGPQCSVTNSKGTTSLFVEIDGVERGSVTAEDSSSSYDPTNGGASHPTTYDNTFNVFDPLMVPNYDNSCTSPTDSTCYGRIHLEIDHDWLAAGYCGSGTFCDPSALNSQTNRTSTKIDVQGFVYWDPGNLDGAYHQFNGWELHPLTGWKLSSSPAPSPVSVSFTSSPPVPQVGQTVSFSASMTGGTSPFTFSWSFGDGTTASGSNVSHMYVTPKEFTVSVTARDSSGKSAEAQKIIDVGSWNSAVACAPAQTILEGVVGNVSIQRLPSNPNSTGADYSGGGFRLDGNLSYGSNPTTWPYFKRDLRPQCSISGTPAFVELHNVTVVDRTVDDCSTTFSVDNGGGPYPNGWQSCDTTFNLVTPGFGDSSTCPQCYMHRVYSGIDRDWNASGVAPPTSLVEGERIDLQGFVYWNNIFVNASWHSYSGWEIHPITAWRSVHQPLTTSVSSNPSNPSPGQTVSFNATASGGAAPYNFTWDFGDGTGASGGQVGHSFAAGAYLIHLAATDSLGTVDLASQTLNVTVPPGFTMSASPVSLTVKPGKTNSSTITLTSVSGFSGNVSLTSSINPIGPTASLSPATVALVPNGSARSFLNVSASATALPGIYQIAVTGRSGNFTGSVQVSITIIGPPTFTLSINPASVLLLAGSSGKDNITVATFGGFKGTVQLTASSLPSGVKAAFNPSGVTLSSGGTALSILTITTATNSPSGNYTLTITGSGGGVTRKIVLPLTITSDFTISASPTSLTTLSGTSKSTTINLKSLGFKGTITLSASVSDPALTATVSPTFLSFNPGQTQSSTLTVRSTTAGSYTVTVVATGGSITHSILVPIAITDFSIAASPTSLAISRGSTGNSTLSLTSLGGFVGTVNLGDTVSAGGLKVTLSRTSVALTTGGTQTVLLTVSSTSTTAPGNYTILVKATSGSLTHTVTIIFTVT